MGIEVARAPLARVALVGLAMALFGGCSSADLRRDAGSDSASTYEAREAGGSSSMDDAGYDGAVAAELEALDSDAGHADDAVVSAYDDEYEGQAEVEADDAIIGPAVAADSAGDRGYDNGLRLAQAPPDSGGAPRSRELTPREPPWPLPEQQPDREQAGPPPAAMYFQDYGVNPWQDAAHDALSTFALDVDTGSYTLARRYLLEGHLPPAEAVRAEEFVNYFDQVLEPPRHDAFAIHLDGAPSPFGDEGERLIRVGVSAREIRDSRREDAVLTFVIDVSGSMEQGGRLDLVVDALEMLLDELGPGDSVAVVAYTDYAWVALEPTRATERSQIRSAVRELYPMASTNAEAGLRLGYDLAEESYRRGAINRVILCSDGVANVGRTGPEAILDRIVLSVDRGIALTTIGVGMGNYNDVLLEQLADAGNGAYYYVDGLDEAEKVFVEDLTGTLQLVARDAKAQVEFNPDVVEHYRLIGYENRDVRDADFRDDRVDAGEVGAGQSVTALYAVHLLPRSAGAIATARVRYTEPDGERVREIESVLRTDDLERRFSDADPRFRLVASAAAFAEILRDSYYNRLTTLDDVIAVAEAAADDLPREQQASELVDLMHVARRAQVTRAWR